MIDGSSVPHEEQTKLKNGIITEQTKKDAQESNSHDSQAILDLLEIIRTEGIELPAGIIGRLKLLDSPKCSMGQCLSSRVEVYTGTDASGVQVEKMNETHLEHTVSLVTMLRRWFLILEQENRGESISREGRKQIITAALLHDIGKTGPEIHNGQRVSEDVHKAFILLFSIFEKDDGKSAKLISVKIEEAIDTHIPAADKDNVKKAVISLGFNIQEQMMSDIFGSHIQYSINTLQAYNEDKAKSIGPEIIYLVAHHHRWTHNFAYQPGEDLRDNLPNDESYREYVDQLATLLELTDVCESVSNRGIQKPYLKSLEIMKTSIYKDIKTGLAKAGVPDEVFDMISKLEVLEGKK